MGITISCFCFVLFCFFKIRGNLGPERLSSLPKVTQAEGNSQRVTCLDLSPECLLSPWPLCAWRGGRGRPKYPRINAWWPLPVPKPQTFSQMIHVVLGKPALWGYSTVWGRDSHPLANCPALNPASVLPGCVPRGGSHLLSEPQFSQLYSGVTPIPPHRAAVKAQWTTGV